MELTGALIAEDDVCWFSNILICLCKEDFNTVALFES